MLARLPWKLIGYVAAAFLILAGANHFASFIPFTPQWSAKRAEAKADRLEGEVDTLTREATGNAEIAVATDTFHTREVIVREVTAQAITEARNAPDAEAPLSDERANRLRAHDQRLCNDTPALCAAADPAPGSAGSVQPSDPS